MKSVLITGASGGIGEAVTNLFLHHGYGVTMMARNTKSIETTANTLWISGDVTSASDVQRTFKQHQNHFNKSPSAVIHCAAVMLPIGPVWKTDPTTWEHTLKVNAFGSYLITRFAIENAIKEKTPCSIVLFSGGGGAYARPYFTAYGSSKTAVLRFVETSAEELQCENLSDLIQINAVAPGGVNTRLTQQIINSGIEGAGEKAFQEALRIENGEGTSPRKAAELSLFLADRKRNGGLSGRLIHVNEPYLRYASAVEDIQKSDKGLLRRVPIQEES